MAWLQRFGIRSDYKTDNLAIRHRILFARSTQGFGARRGDCVPHAGPVPERRSGRPERAGGANPLRAHRLRVLCEKMPTCARTPAVPEDSQVAPGTLLSSPNTNMRCLCLCHFRTDTCGPRPEVRLGRLAAASRWIYFDRADGTAPDLGRTNSGIDFRNVQPVKITVTRYWRVHRRNSVATGRAIG